MDQKILDFLDKERVGVISVILPDGASHSATVHYSYLDNPLRFFIMTKNTTAKVKPFLDGQTGKASMVIGFSEEEFKTLQMRGDMKIISDPTELENAQKVMFTKHPDHQKHLGPNTVFLEFVPTWYRYTDVKSDPKVMIEK